MGTVWEPGLPARSRRGLSHSHVPTFPRSHVHTFPRALALRAHDRFDADHGTEIAQVFELADVECADQQLDRLAFPGLLEAEFLEGGERLLRHIAQEDHHVHAVVDDLQPADGQIAVPAVFLDLCRQLTQRLGQNILVNPNVRDRIIEAMDLRADDTIIEIGAGTGALTEALVAVAGHVIAFEVDRGLEPVLRAQLGDTEELAIRREDFLEADLPRLSKQAVPDGLLREHLVFAGNLPYSITTPVITRVLESGVPFRAAYFTVQREVAQRLLAPPGSRDRGAITFLVEYHAEARRLLKVPRTAFEPVPKVESVLIGLTARRTPPVSPREPELMFALVRAAFGARRKVLKNALRRLEWDALTDDNVADRVAAAIRECGLDPRCRGEQLTLQQFADLSDALVRTRAADRGTP